MTKRSEEGARAEVPGNVIESARRFEKYLHKMGLGWLRCRETLAALEDDDVHITRVTLKGSWSEGEELLVIINADGPDGPVVGFHRVAHIESLWQGLLSRLDRKDIQWKEDKPYGEQ